MSSVTIEPLTIVDELTVSGPGGPPPAFFINLISLCSNN
jgi:hypothetical protein